MPGTRTDYGQVYDHTLNARKGWALGLDLPLEKALPIASGLSNRVYRGRVVHIDSNTYKLGVNNANSTSRCRIPAFAFANENDPDVNPNLGNISGGVLNALLAIGTFELESTEFDANGTYDCGSYLTSDDGSGSSGTGVIKTGALATDTIVGIISEKGEQANGSFEGEHGQKLIRFVTWFLPSKIQVH